MVKKILVGMVVGASLVSTLSADSLKEGMAKLEGSFLTVQHAYLVNDRDGAMRALGDLRVNVHNYLGSDAKVKSLLPKDLKDREKIGVNSGRLIKKYITNIESIYFSQHLNKIQAQVQAQDELLNIQKQCFKCHNLVRDWNK